MKNIRTLAIIFWLCLWLPFTGFMLWSNADTPVVTGILTITAIVLASPAAIFLAEILTNKEKAHTTVTHLSPHEGIMAGPNYGLPPDTIIRYRWAAKHPEITIYKENGRPIGWEADFGNGIVGCVRGRQTIRLLRGNLSVKVTGPGGTQSVNW